MSRVGIAVRALVVAASLILVACGGGGSSSSSTVASSSSSSSGGSSGGTTTTSSNCPTTREMNTAGTANAAAIYMDTCPISASSQTANIPYVSVYLCAPGSTTNCAWIDHIQVDTGSIGLRVLASAIPTAVLAGLTPVTVNGQNLGECYNFVLSYFWGGLRTADVGLGGSAAPNSTAAFNGLKAAGTVLHVLNDSNLPATAPSTCTSNSTGGAETTAATIGANGVIGIGLFADDCNGFANCTYGANASPGIYYLCPSTSVTSCSGFSPTAAAQVVPNPISAAQLPGSSLTLNTGQSIAAAAVSYPISAGVTNYSSVAGTLNFGVPTVGTSGGPSSILLADVNSGLLSGSVNGFDYPSFDSTVLTQAQDTAGLYTFGVFIDSGSNAIFYYDQNTTANGLSPLSSIGNPLSAAITCGSGTTAANAGFQCISGNTSLNAIIQLSAVGTAPTTGTVILGSAGSGQLAPLTLYDANYLFNTPSLQNGPAFAGLISAPNKAFANEFDLGIPSFFGRTIWFGIANATVSNGNNALSNVPYYGI